ncbi:MAG: M28 family peptidase [Gammaproteobacteria bacterium]
MTVHRLRTIAAVLAIGTMLGGCAGEQANVRLNSRAPDFDGALAWHYAVTATTFGPRPPGSAAHARLLSWIEMQLAGTEWKAVRFTAQTPAGPIAMTNVVARFQGTAPGIVVISGHYDTLSGRPDFVGANDGGSSTGILLALADHFRAHPPVGPSVWIVWFDGEEAIREWSGEDHTYGSRELASRWRADGTAAKIRAVLVLDMIGDRDLDIARDTASTPWLMTRVCTGADEIGAGSDFCRYRLSVEDDHSPFIAAGIPAADIIDFDYGPSNSYWHTDKDTPDKLSPASFRIVGSVVLATLRSLAADSPPP